MAESLVEAATVVQEWEAVAVVEVTLEEQVVLDLVVVVVHLSLQPRLLQLI